MPELTGAVLLFILGYGVSAIFAALLMNYIIQPVYTFPEWFRRCWWSGRILQRHSGTYGKTRR